MSSDLLIQKLVDFYSIKDSIKSSFRSSPYSIDIFFEGKTLTANFRKKIAVLEIVESRTVFRESNFLHLNNPKKLWTWVADIFALALIVLAGTGLFMIKGKNGIKGRGKWLTFLGFLIPIIFLFLYF
jgi:hypothetical protein